MKHSFAGNREIIFVFIISYVKNLKTKGKADTKHNPSIPEDDLIQVFQLGVVLHGILDGSNDDLTRLPADWENTYHYLAQYVAIVILEFHLGRRGREGINSLKKSDFDIFEHPKVGRYYQKIKGEASKNHKMDSEVLENGGIIMFSMNKYGLNCGQYLKDYIAKLDPTSEYLFTRPRRYVFCRQTV